MTFSGSNLSAKQAFLIILPIPSTRDNGTLMSTAQIAPPSTIAREE